LSISQNVGQWMYWDAELSEPAQLGNQEESQKSYLWYNMH